MALKANRAGRILGPDNRTNTDLYNILSNINTNLGQMKTLLEQISFGVTATYQNLNAVNAYLSGSATVSVNTALALPTMAHETRVAAKAILAILQSGGGGGDYTAVLQAIQGGVTGLQAQLAVTNDSLGVRGESEVNLSALGYLALIANSTERAADCCEDGQPVDTGEMPPPSPTFACELAGGPMRASSYFFWRNSPAEALDEYIVRFTGIDTQSGGEVIEFNSLDANPLPALTSSFDMQYCFEWNHASGQVPGQILRYLAGPDNTFVGSTGTIITPTIGEGSGPAEQLDAGNGGILYTVKIDEGTGPPAHLNYWLRWEAVPS